MPGAKVDRPTTGPAATIRAARALADLTTQELADQIGVHRDTVSRWETGRVTDFQPGHLRAAAQACNVPLWFIEHGFNGHQGET